MRAYEGLRPFFGDLHSHCGISYGHGPIEDALANAREQLDFCSVTGHAFWPDMPPPAPAYQHIIDFHEEGFARLREQWPHAVEQARAASEEGTFLAFPGFEMHSSAEGDHTVVYRDCQGEILYCEGLAALRERLRGLRNSGAEAVVFPHHLGYRRGRRGVNWDVFTDEFSPVVEIVSMHGCSESDEPPRRFLHTMGPLNHEGTMQFGLEQGHRFGVIGGTDHHSAHPGSHGHGRCCVWARELTREAIWEGIYARRTSALTGDRIELRFSLNGHPMGSAAPASPSRRLEIDVAAGGPIDYVDIVRDNRLLRRFSACDVERTEPSGAFRTRLFLELGWGQRGQQFTWDAVFGISEGHIRTVEPRLKGAEVVSPLDSDGGGTSYHTAHWERRDDRSVSVRCVTQGNPNNFTCGTQGICLDAEVTMDARVEAVLNGTPVSIPVRTLVEGARGDRIGSLESPSYRVHRAPLPWEWHWRLEHEDVAEGASFYYVRVRQANDQWAWSSPVWVEPGR
jgi:hypothetical protein